MDKAKTYLKRLQERAFRRTGGFDLFPPDNVTPELMQAAQIRNDQLAEMAGDDRRFIISEAAHLSGKFYLEALINDLKEELYRWLEPRHHALVDQSVLSFLPTAFATGFCTSHDDHRSPLDGHIIALNYGLHYCSSLLADAVIMENLTGELETFRRDGKEYFQSACKIFLSPSVETIERELSKDEGFPDAVRHEIALNSSPFSMIMLTFVALHEVGHLFYGDTEASYVSLKSHGEPFLRDNTNTEPVPTDWAMEFRADSFAAETICRHSSSEATAWSNFAAITMLMLWFDYLERSEGKPLTATHPPFSQRFDAVLAIFQANTREHRTDYISWVKNAIARWTEETP